MGLIPTCRTRANHNVCERTEDPRLGSWNPRAGVEVVAAVAEISIDRIVGVAEDDCTWRRLAAERFVDSFAGQLEPHRGIDDSIAP